MTDKQPKETIPPEEIQSAHPVEPAEGARQPGSGAGADRPPHPTQPAEGERETPPNELSRE